MMCYFQMKNCIQGCVFALDEYTAIIKGEIFPLFVHFYYVDPVINSLIISN